MPWWGWMVVGLLLLAAELLFIEANFFLVFLGVAAVLAGVLAWALPELPAWGQFVAFAVLALVSMVLFRRRVYRLLRPKLADLPDDMLREQLELPSGLPVDGNCRVELRGSTWNARNVGAVPIAPGGKARVVGVDGITLKVEAIG